MFVVSSWKKKMQLEVNVFTANKQSKWKKCNETPCTSTSRISWTSAMTTMKSPKRFSATSIASNLISVKSSPISFSPSQTSRKNHIKITRIPPLSSHLFPCLTDYLRFPPNSLGARLTTTSWVSTTWLSRRKSVTCVRQKSESWTALKVLWLVHRKCVLNCSTAASTARSVTRKSAKSSNNSNSLNRKSARTLAATITASGLSSQTQVSSQISRNCASKKNLRISHQVACPDRLMSSSETKSSIKPSQVTSASSPDISLSFQTWRHSLSQVKRRKWASKTKESVCVTKAQTTVWLVSRNSDNVTSTTSSSS